MPQRVTWRNSTEGVAISSISRMVFNGPDYVIANLVARNDMENIYYLNGVATDKSAVDAFCSEWYERTDPLWANYE